MSQAINVGDRFGRLTVSGWAAKDSQDKLCLCMCDCGATVTVAARNLIYGDNTRSCGCYRSDRMRDLRAYRAQRDQSRIARKAKLIAKPPRKETRTGRAARYRKLRSDGFTLSEIAAADGVSKQYVSAESKYAG